LIIDGHTIFESVAISEYLEETRKERPLLPSDPAKKALVRQLYEIINSGIQPLQNLPILEKIEKEYKGDKLAWA